MIRRQPVFRPVARYNLSSLAWNRRKGAVGGHHGKTTVQVVGLGSDFVL